MSSMLTALVPYLLVTLASALSLTLFLLLKADIRRAAGASQKDQSALADTLRELEIRLAAAEETLSQRAVKTEPAPAPPSAPVNPRLAMNLQRRAQILRMAQKGQSPDQIAVSLCVPQNEVDLLLKLHSVAQQAAAC